MLTIGSDNQTGTTGDDLFLSPNGGLGAGDAINGLAGRDVIALTESGTLDASLATLTSIEELRGSSGADTIIIAGSTVASGVVKIDGGAGDDTIKLNSWAVDLLNITVTGIEHITGLAGRSVMVRVADYATALLLDGNGLNMTLDAGNMLLTLQQRQELFSHGVDVIYQPDGYIYDADGSILRAGTVTTVNTSSGVMGEPAMAHLLSGGYVTTWDAQVGAERGIYGQRYDAAGNKIGSEFRVDSATHAPNSYGDRFGASITGLADGGYVIAWASLGQDGSYYGIYTQRYTSTGTAVGTETLVNKTTLESQYLPKIDALANGDYVVTWRLAETYGFNSDVYIQRLNSSGVPLGTETSVNTTTAGYQDFPVITHLENGGFVVAWMSDDGSGNVVTP